jgi:predicted MPP superfamily phosphohydrolase
VCHISDLHYTTGERAYAERICREIRTLRPDLVCFTGDLADSEPGIREALALLGQLGCPVYGVPGNHDTADSDLYRAAIAATGGEWLENQAVSRPGSRGMICGMAHRGPRPVAVSGPRPWILLVHTPQAVANLRDPSFDVILAGHSHGGQVRLPWFGALVLPYGVGRYDRGLYRTPAGPLHVSTGLGTFFLPMRFLCRPEITLVEL